MLLESCVTQVIMQYILFWVKELKKKHLIPFIMIQEL
jgi:hypothetical protein